MFETTTSRTSLHSKRNRLTWPRRFGQPTSGSASSDDANAKDICCVSAIPKKSGAAAGELEFMDVWYPIQVKQKDKLGRPDVDSFEAIMTRHDRTKGFLVSFDYSTDALAEIDAFFRKCGKVIVPLTVREILEEEIARKLA